MLDATFFLLMVVAASILEKKNEKTAVALRKRGLVDTHPNCDELQIQLHQH